MKTTPKKTNEKNPSTAKTHVGWECENCKQINSYSLEYCAKCGSKRP